MNKKITIIKVGGNIIDDDVKLNAFLSSLAKMEGPKILVHGGGKLATKLAADLSIPQQMVDGRRITDAETLRIVTMVYAGLINKQIVARLNANQCKSIGVCGADAQSIRAHKRIHPSIDFGFVGDVDSVDADFLFSLLNEGLTVVMAPITQDENGQLLNTNADTIAQEIAKSLAHKASITLIYSFEKKGVLRDVQDEKSVIKKIDQSLYSKLKSEQAIFAGMIPKLDNAFEAINAGVNRVIIGDATQLEDLLEGKSGTVIS